MSHHAAMHVDWNSNQLYPSQPIHAQCHALQHNTKHIIVVESSLLDGIQITTFLL